ncbi:MAG: 50S ribosomal protein L21 [Candidatus Magasanikbacteria bacterium CG_4_9_14_0_2_um_filter_41_10]|uniref:Large ribosomal subunit protein bL21 n=1 Tax=Candidatus Magasanikbacteria bacterium CG_4_10_14_0_2_um_filter_41_31 TaxID=1974639 RepID=A0A2M7V5Y1_9BACT|nr:MAG: 50S ribosomal protein L21 [Candidatus Magasanikbacteria bacterium CG1_02_41_34]PIZ94019.1 MAG: 50S ribosomal protein L21 [Candidatus Magasanikbacteria bacterium CG_4_10_14_0_2_um_filter_41_31]PJC53272.1 MAG: 50S ribosomal protein L21 [Candidatus Magasanikbacteria bacterium CG_4_9_14_0_2_um_filter_41_10]
MFAVVFTGGKQYFVEEGQTINIEKLETEIGNTVTFDQILLTAKGDGQDVEIGMPFLVGKTITATVKDQGRAKKIRVVKYKPKTRYKRVNGHRQPFTTVTIDKIA